MKSLLSNLIDSMVQILGVHSCLSFARILCFREQTQISISKTKCGLGVTNNKAFVVLIDLP